MKLHRVLIALIVACMVRSAFAEDRLASGLVLLEEAARVRQTQPQHAARLGADAAALIAAGIEEAGVENPAAQRALGNAWLLAEENGRAVLAFRRAELGAPDDPLVRSSLMHARSIVGAEVGAGSADASGWRGMVLSWRHHVPRAWVFWGSLGVFVGCCWIVALRVLGKAPARVTGPATVLGVLGATTLGVLAAEPHFDGRDSGVVIAEAMGHTGPHAEVYPAALNGTVPAGTEVRLIESRDGWVRCAIGGLEAWLPVDKVERVRPLIPPSASQGAG